MAERIGRRSKLKKQIKRLVEGTELENLYNQRKALVDKISELELRIKKYEDEDSHEAMSCYVSHEKTDDLEAKLKIAVEALKQECACGPLPEVLCDACEALAEISGGADDGK